LEAEEEEDHEEEMEEQHGPDGARSSEHFAALYARHFACPLCLLKHLIDLRLRVLLALGWATNFELISNSFMGIKVFYLSWCLMIF